MKKIFTFFATILTVAVTGCATPPQLPVDLSPKALAPQGVKFGIAMTALPKIDTSFPGANCLLCIAAASVANSSLSKHTATLGYEDLPDLKNKVAEVLRKKGATVVVIPEVVDLKSLGRSGTQAMNFSAYDFSELKKKYNIDKLLLVNITELGFERTYASYFPTSDPKATFVGQSYIVDLSSNGFDWYAPIVIKKSADGKWDEAPQYPGLTNAYYSVIELGKDNILKPLGN